MKKLIIAEKPSVARNIADAVKIKNRKNGYIEGDDYVITWVFGHLLQLYDAVDYDEDMKSWNLNKFPFIPENFKYKVKMDRYKKIEDEGAKKQLNLIKALMEREDINEIVSATDWDREGQIIGDELFLYIHTKKPVKRLLLNEWTPKEVQTGLQNLKLNDELSSLKDAGFARQIADWIIGINLTSVATVKHKNVGGKGMLNIGRVIMPTLKIIYDRDKEIKEFISTSYYKLNVDMHTLDDNIFKGVFVKKCDDGKLKEEFDDRKTLDEFLKNIDNKKFVVLSKEEEEKSENPPYLFNLSNLQGFITSKYKGFTSDKVLKVAQELYEKKLITYPRTASIVLDESLKEKARKVLEVHKKGRVFESEISFKDSKRIFDSKKVDSHSAIIPTYVIAKNLSEDEKKIYDAIVNRFLAQFMPKAISQETKIIIGENLESEDLILVRGKIQLQEGFRRAESITTRDNIIPILNEEDEVFIKESKVNEVKRKPPKHHTEKTLLKIMETCGKGAVNEEENEEMMMSILSGYSIGTPATRAETIKKLKDIGYIEAQKKSLKITSLGEMIVETFPVKELFDLNYTGKLEKTLSDIEKKKYDQREFLKLISQFTKDAVEKIKQDISFANRPIIEDKEKIVGICPNCKSFILENEKAYGCANWKNGCDFTIWKDDKYIRGFGKEVTRDMVKILLENGKVGFRRLQSKSGNIFAGYFKYEKDKETKKYKWSIEFI